MNSYPKNNLCVELPILKSSFYQTRKNKVVFIEIICCGYSRVHNPIISDSHIDRKSWQTGETEKERLEREMETAGCSRTRSRF